MARIGGLGAILITCICIGSVYSQQKQIYKLCAIEGKGNIQNYCNVLGKSESFVNCVKVKDSVDCSLKLKKGLADFGTYSAEEAILASKFIDDVAQVTHELHSTGDYLQEPFAFQTVVVVKKDFPGEIKNLRNKNYCHPGFQDSQFWTDWVLKYFETKVVPQTCDKSLTAAVNELKAIDNFFNQTCRPGDWVHNEYYNTKLKRDFKGLCSLCDNPGEACTYHNLRSRGDHANALYCVTKGRGDVTYVSLQSVKEFFGLKPGFPQYASPDQFMFLCQNGSMQSITTQQPCAWIRQPWNSVVAAKTVAEGVKKNLTMWLDAPARGSWQESLKKIILEDTYYQLVNTSELRSLTGYIELGREIPKKGAAATCKDPIRWCALPEENEKCEWMRAAALTHGITPEINCLAGRDHWDCFTKIQNDKADFIGIHTNLGYIAKHTYDLTTQLLQETYAEADYQAIAVIANVRASTGITTPIRTMADLRGRKACFPEYGGIAWVSYVESLRKSEVLRNACPFGNTLGQFFKSVCAPGARDPVRDPKGQNTMANLCSLCDGNCNATLFNPYYGDAGAFKCLTNGADVAFVNGLRLKNLTAAMTSDEVSQYSILCNDGTIRALTDEITETCPLIRVVSGEVIGRRTRTKEQSIDFYLALLEMDDWFGLSPRNAESVFRMYEEFDSKKGLIFKEDTIGLINSYDQQLDIVRDYIELKARADQCGATGGSPSVLVGHITWILAAVLALVSVKQ